jgi:hypothetical protein
MLDEFARALERVPERIKPLGVTARRADRVTLGATAEIRRSSLPPPPVKIADDSFFAGTVAKQRRTPEAPATGAKVPALPIVNAALPLVTEERVARKSSRPAARHAAAPARRMSQNMIPIVAPAPKLPSEAKVPSENMIPVIAPAPKPPRTSPKPPAKKSIPPKKSVAPPKKSAAPKRSVSPLAGSEETETVDTGWDDE